MIYSDISVDECMTGGPEMECIKAGVEKCFMLTAANYY